MAASTVNAAFAATVNHRNSGDGGEQQLLMKRHRSRRCKKTIRLHHRTTKYCDCNNRNVCSKTTVAQQPIIHDRIFYDLLKLAVHCLNLLYSTSYPPSLMRRRATTILSAILFLLTVNTRYSSALKSSMTYVPQGTNTLLYRPGGEPIMQLDQLTFADTVFEQGRTQAFLVEFYADWCGHCRAFAPFYRELSSRAFNWRPVVQIAAMNCADNFNSQVCGANGVTYFPMIKYFPRYASGYGDGMALEASHSVDNLLDQLSSKIVNENQLHAYADWPNFKFIQINGRTRFDDLWEGGAPSANFLVIVFESLEQSAGNSAGFRLIFELLPYRSHVVVRRALSNSPLATQMLRITVFPYAAMFRRGDQQSIFMEPVHAGTSQSVLSRAQPGQMVTIATTPAVYVQSTTAAPVFDCDTRPERCRPLYFVSESDMLRAMRMALVDEVARPNGLIQGRNFTHLYNFVTLLTDYFPVFTFERNNKIGKDRMRRAQALSDKSPSTKTLRKSERARRVFVHMKSVLDAQKRASVGGGADASAISAVEWRNQFTSVERLYENPFPVNASWQHCRGTTPDYRGYTCALWTTFHMLTVHTYLHSLNNATQGSQIGNSMRTLKAIQGWVESFFGCNHCRNHFMEMTTQKFPMNETRIRRAQDAMLYLWRAHNIVNKRLHGQSTEDPQFLKYQFPPPFLCPTCSAGGSFSRRQVRAFLINYYSDIRPVVALDGSGSGGGGGGDRRRRVRLLN